MPHQPIRNLLLNLLMGFYDVVEAVSEVRDLSERFDFLVEYVESKHGFIASLHGVDTNKSEALFQDMEVVIGVVPSTYNGYLDYVKYVEAVIEPDLNALAWEMGSDIKFSFEVRNADGQSAMHLEQVQYLNTLGVKMVLGGMWSSYACASLSYCNYNDILLFSPSSTSPLPTIEDDNLFRLVPTDVKQGPVISEMIQSKSVEALILIQR